MIGRDLFIGFWALIDVVELSAEAPPCLVALSRGEERPTRGGLRSISSYLSNR